MKVLVTGATGFVGRVLLPALLAAGHSPRAVVRDPERANLPPDVGSAVIPDIGPDTDWSAALEGMEGVIHLAARVHAVGESVGDPLGLHKRVNLEGTRRLAESAATAGVHRFVYASTIKVNGDGTPSNRPFRESDRPQPQGPYAVSKWQAERALAEIAHADGMTVTVVRPPLVYGPEVRANFRLLLRLADSGLPLPFGGIAGRQSMIYVGNLADALVRCLDHPGAFGATFLVRDGEDLSTSALIARLRQAFGRPRRLISVPAPLLRMAASVVGRGETLRRVLDSLLVDDGQIRRALGWTPPFTLDQGLAATAAWFGADRGRT